MSDKQEPLKYLIEVAPGTEQEIARVLEQSGVRFHAGDQLIGLGDNGRWNTGDQAQHLLRGINQELRCRDNGPQIPEQGLPNWDPRKLQQLLDLSVKELEWEEGRAVWASWDTQEEWEETTRRYPLLFPPE